MAKAKVEVVKRFKNGAVLYSNGYVRTPPVRLAFVNVASPRKNEDDPDATEKYGVTCLFKKGEDMSPLNLARDRFMKATFKNGTPKKFKFPFRKQDEKVDEYDGFVRGAIFLNATSKFQPQIVDKSNEEMEPSEVYSGCWARVVLNPYQYDTRGNKGMAFGLQAIQFVKDDEKLSGGIPASDLFDADDNDGDDSDDSDDSGSEDDDDDLIG